MFSMPVTGEMWVSRKNPARSVEIKSVDEDSIYYSSSLFNRAISVMNKEDFLKRYYPVGSEGDYLNE